MHAPAASLAARCGRPRPPDGGTGGSPNDTTDDDADRWNRVKELVRLRVNGDNVEVGVPSQYTLLETLRYALGLTGSKQGCDKGDCGACTVVLDGRAVLSCILPVQEAAGRDVLTVEGLADGPAPHVLQDALDVTGGAQCGFCTPGILCSAWVLLEENPAATREEIAAALAGNLCRCTGYTKIFEAVELAGEAMRTGRRPGDIIQPLRVE